MPELPIPQRGQPLDVSYISSIVTTVNQLLRQSSPTSSNNTKIVGTTTPRTEYAVPTPGASIYGETVNVTNAATTTAGGEIPFKVNFSFKYPPIVVATPWNKGGTEAGKNVSIYLTNVTTSEANLVAKFASNGVATIDVNVLVIGIPNWNA